VLLDQVDLLRSSDSLIAAHEAYVVLNVYSDAKPPLHTSSGRLRILVRTTKSSTRCAFLILRSPLRTLPPAQRRAMTPAEWSGSSQHQKMAPHAA